MTQARKEHKQVDAVEELQKMSALLRDEEADHLKDPEFLKMFKLFSLIVLPREKFPAGFESLHLYLLTHCHTVASMVYADIEGEFVSIAKIQEPTLREYLHNCLRVAVKIKDYATVEFLLQHAISQKLDVNDGSPIGRRTAAHYAQFDEKMLALLEKFPGFNLWTLDYQGFTAADYLLNPVDYHPTLDCLGDRAIVEELFSHYLVDQRNTVRKNAGKSGVIFYVQTVDEMEIYIEKNPSLVKMGFIIARPNCNKNFKDMRDIHVTPVYFERLKGRDAFCQYDSAGHPPIAISRSKKERIFYYNTMPRQASDHGCFSDALAILDKCLDCTDLENFYQRNAKLDGMIHKVVSVQEFAIFEQLEAKNARKQLSPWECGMHHGIRQRIKYQVQAKVFEYKRLEPVQNIYFLADLHPELLQFEERYDCMRTVLDTLRKDKPKRVAEVIEKLRVGGAIRRDPGASWDVIKAGKIPAGKESKDLDIKGCDFLQRREDEIKETEARRAEIHRFFGGKKVASLVIGYEYGDKFVARYRKR